MSIRPAAGIENQNQGFWSSAEIEKYSLPQQIILSKNEIYTRKRENLR